MCYLAKKFINELRRTQPELGITNEDVLCIQIAALCFNMGHGPFSFLFQDLFRQQIAEQEDISPMVSDKWDKTLNNYCIDNRTSICLYV